MNLDHPTVGADPFEVVRFKASREFHALVNEATRAPRWIVDGNYDHIRELTWDRATAVLWLNYTFARVWGQALKRTLVRVTTREEICNGNRETLKQTLFTRESILWWILATHRSRQRLYRDRFDRGPTDGQSYIELRSPREMERFLRGAEPSRRDAENAEARGAD